MGCRISKLDEKEEIPVRLGSFRRRTSEIKRRRQVRNVSSVSTTELLKLEDRDGDKGDFVKKTDEKMSMAVVAIKVKEQRKKNKNVVRRDEKEEFPGSPSFRVYFSDGATFKESDDDPVKVIKKNKEERLAKEKERIPTNEDKERVKTHEMEQNMDSLISNEDSSNKPPKKEWGRRFKALTKVPSRVYTFFTVKNCYGPGTSSDHVTSGLSPGHHAAVKPS